MRPSLNFFPPPLIIFFFRKFSFPPPERSKPRYSMSSRSQGRVEFWLFSSVSPGPVRLSIHSLWLRHFLSPSSRASKPRSSKSPFVFEATAETSAFFCIQKPLFSPLVAACFKGCFFSADLRRQSKRSPYLIRIVFSFSPSRCP